MMYVTFIEYFLEREMPVMNDARKNYVEEFINDSFENHSTGQWSTELYSLLRLKFDVIDVDSECITIWLRQSGRETMRHALNDLITVLDAGECVDWSKIPRSVHHHGELEA